MRVLKYTFDIPQLIVENDELIEMGSKQETYTFTLLFKGVDLYEKLSNKALLTDIAKLSNQDQNQLANNLDVDMIKNLAKASYAKIENNTFHQNLITADEFSKTQAFQRIGIDTDFMVALLNMAVECCVSGKQTNNTHPTKK